MDFMGLFYACSAKSKGISPRRREGRQEKQKIDFGLKKTKNISGF
jgi:hypothetical protein